MSDLRLTNSDRDLIGLLDSVSLDLRRAAPHLDALFHAQGQIIDELVSRLNEARPVRNPVVAEELRKVFDVPIELIDTSFGEIPASTLKRQPDHVQRKAEQ